MVLVFISTHTLTYTNNPPKAYTGAPGESNCTSCHSGTAITSGTEYSNVKLTTNMTNDEYIPDSTYKITISYTESGKSKFGFMTTALKSSDNSRIGSFSLLSSTTTAKGTETVNSKTREYVYHKGAGTSGSGKISWSFEWDAPSADEGDIDFHVALNSTNSNNGSSGDKIILKEFTFKPSSKLPKAKISASTNTVCVGDTFLLDATKSSNAVTYKWKTNGGSQKSTSDSVIKVVWSSSGTKNVRLSAINGIGASPEDTLKVKVLPKPSNAVTKTDSIVCTGESIFLEATDGIAWEWSTSEKSQKIEVRQSGTYHVIVEGSNGCKIKSADIDLTVVPRLSISINSANGKDSFCTNDSVVLEFSEPLDTFELIDKGTPFAWGAGRRIAFMAPPDQYFITASGKDTFGCDAGPSNQLQLFVEQQASGPSAQCVNVETESLAISWAPDPLLNKYQVSLDSGKTWVSANDPSGLGHNVDGLTFGTTVSFWVRGKTFKVCDYSEMEQLTCKTKNCFKVSYDVDAPDVCDGDSAVIKINNLSLSKYGLAFNGGAYGLETEFRFLNDTGSHDVSLSFVDSSALSCPSVDTTIVVSINPNPNPFSTTAWQKIEGDNKICADTLAKLLTGNNMEDGIAYSDVSWSGTGVSKSGSDYLFDPSVGGAGNTQLVYHATNQFNCIDSTVVDVVVDPQLSATFVAAPKGRNVAFTQTVINATSWTWDFGDGDTSQRANPSHYFNMDGTYDVTLTATAEGSACPDVVHTETLNLVGDGVNYASLNAKLYPMPFTGVLNIQMSDASEQYELRVYNLAGEMVFTQLNTNANSSIDLSHLDEGAYLLYVASENQVFTKTVIKI